MNRIKGPIVFFIIYAYFSVDQSLSTNSILASANTTIAIQIDRNTSTEATLKELSSFSSILVPFVGGPNDRSALQLAFRFHRHAKVKLTVVHITLVGRPVYNKLDADLLHALKELKKDGDVGLQEIRVDRNDFKPVLEAIKEKHADLIILGYSTAFPVKKQDGVNGKTASFFRFKKVKEHRQPRYTHTFLQVRILGTTELDTPREAPKSTSLIRRFSQKSINISDEEKIFGSLGEYFYSTPSIVPSMLVLHEPKSQGTNGHTAA